jgi:hypothetical protein
MVTFNSFAATVAPGKELVLRFGCDAKATLAHFDVLDFARSRLDWAPVTWRCSMLNGKIKDQL